MATFKRRVAYLESTGTQWIDTGVAPDFVGGDKIEIGFYNSEKTGAYVAVGCRATGARNGFYVTGGGVVVADRTSFDSVGTIDVGDYVISLDDAHCTINGIADTNTKRVTCAFSAYLFALNQSNSAITLYPGMRLYYWKYWRNGALTQHFIPALDTDNVPCMYDTVSKTCFYNQGTGAFKYKELPEYTTSLVHPMNTMGVHKSPYFTIDLNITSDNLQFGVQPYWNTGGYCKIVDWGDGTSTDATTSGTKLTHTYSAAGKYRVKVIGSMYRFRVGSTNPAAVIDCNGNWDALGTITDGNSMFLGASNAVFSLTSVPTTLVNGQNMFSNCSARISLTMLPPGLTNALNMFSSATHAVLNLDALVANALPGAWESLTNVGTICRMAGTGNTPNSVTGSIARFFRRCPNASNALGAFSFTAAQVWGDYTDYFEITLTTTEANQSWGFTATSSAGNWYCVQWENGENTAGYGSFTNGTKVSHTFATPGTYHIKLATAPCTIVFDAYDSDNGNWAALGQP